MVGSVPASLRRSIAGFTEPQPDIEEYLEGRDRVMARVVHLIRRRRVEVERAARLLRLHFINRRTRSPMRGTLHWMMLVGQYADISRLDREDGNYTDLEIWAFVDHDAFKGMNRYWGIARAAAAHELQGRATLTLSVFAMREVEQMRAAGKDFLTSRYDGGIVLYDRATDGPRDAEAQAAHDNIKVKTATLPALPREAFRLYRKHGLDHQLIAIRMAIGEAQAQKHLADALRTLIPALGDDAFPRSLRPRLERHPRHNLNLFHRPADHDRILSVREARS